MARATPRRTSGPGRTPRQLAIVHYHFRPGGVRRVIELLAAPLAQALRAEAIVLVTGERPPPEWLRAFRRGAGAMPVRVRVDPLLGYAEDRVDGSLVRTALDRAIGESAVVWAHNLALGRNLALSAELAAHCAARALPLLSHHHDWWCDRRWMRWPTLRRCGFRTLDAIAAAIFPPTPSLAHIGINRADARLLRRSFATRAHWLPNPIQRPRRQPPSRASREPVWLMPCRILRRKNIAEALLLTRWLRPTARLVVSGAADEIDEMPYARALAAAARALRWPLQLAAHRAASIEELYATAEAIVFTSIQEGFGLPQLEAAAAGRPAIVRRVPLVAPDLAALGFRFPQSYGEILIAPELFDWRAERRRQALAFRAWLRNLPRAVRPLAGIPAVLSHRSRPRAVAFSRLTLAAQLEVLRHAPEASWSRCAPLNRSLDAWRDLAARGALAATPWPRGASAPLSPRHCAQRLAAIAADTAGKPARASDGVAAQWDFIRARLSAAEMFPLLWSPQV